MRNNAVCPRVINHMPYFPIDVEVILYTDDNTSQWSDLSLDEKLISGFNEELTSFVDNRRYFDLNDNIKDWYCQHRNDKVFFGHLYKAAMGIPLGRMYKECISTLK